jgi:hypothetical protein
MSATTNNDPGQSAVSDDRAEKSSRPSSPPPHDPSGDEDLTFRTRNRLAARSLRRRTIVGIMAIIVGFTIYGAADLISIGLFRNFYLGLPPDIISSMFSRIGLFVVGLGILSTTLINYLQFGAFLPRSQDITKHLVPGK